MAKTKTRAAADLPEELLDRSIGVLEGPVNAVVERVLRSRVVLWPLGLSLAIGWRAAALMMGKSLSKTSTSSPSARN